MSGARPAAMPQAIRDLATRLVHDVGKYVARTAHNVRPGEWTPELSAMLYRDLFALPGGRASVVCARLGGALEAQVGVRPELGQTRVLLAALDGLEPAVRAGDEPACERAAELALTVERTLRTLVGNLAKEAP
jgi:hypothetical protein